MVLVDEVEINELIKLESLVLLGVGNWFSEWYCQGIYDGMCDDGFYGLFDVDIVKCDDVIGIWLKLNVCNMGFDNCEIRGEYLCQGDFGVMLEYNRILCDDLNIYMICL